jgi:hypothetical protein
VFHNYVANIYYFFDMEIFFCIFMLFFHLGQVWRKWVVHRVGNRVREGGKEWGSRRVGIDGRRVGCGVGNKAKPERTYSEPTARGRWLEGGEAGTGGKGAEEGGGMDVEQINFAAAQ